MSLMSEARARRSEVDVAWQPCALGTRMKPAPKARRGRGAYVGVPHLFRREGRAFPLQTNPSFGRSATSGF